MKFRFVWIGKTREKNWLALQEEYLRRLAHFVRFDVNEIRESERHENIEIEGKRILAAISPGAFVVLLDVEGKMLTSQELSKQIETWQNAGQREIVFIIGGQDGTAKTVLKRADFCLSLSRLTFTHETARVLLAEQLYRAFTILHRFPYQK
jgi:23S rRNA (pseudouridine1915-N3)-methyltransferase